MKNKYNHVAYTCVVGFESDPGLSACDAGSLRLVLQLRPTVQTGEMGETVTLNDPAVNTG